MGTALFAPETFNLAETTRAIEVARALRDRHECVFMGYSDRYAYLVRSAGFVYHPLEPRLTDDQADQLIRVDQGRGVRHPFTVRVVRMRVASELALIARVGADVVVIGTTLTQLLSARIARVPLVYVKPFAYSAPHVRQIESVPLLRGDHPGTRAVNGLAARALRIVAGRVTVKPRAFRIVAREHGLALPRLTIDALDGDLNLVASVSGFLHDQALPDDYRLVGPVYARLDGEVPEAVVAAVAAARSAGRPVVYVAMGSSGNRALARRILSALSAMPVTVVAPVAHYLEAEDLAGLGPDVLVCGLLPAHRMGELVDASVIHGGEGTVQTAIAGGKPFVGIGLQMEQRWNIDDCVRFGSAIRVAPRDVGLPRFAAAVHQVLTDAGLRSRASDLQARLAGVDGAAAAADHVDRVVRG